MYASLSMQEAVLRVACLGIHASLYMQIYERVTELHAMIFW